MGHSRPVAGLLYLITLYNAQIEVRPLLKLLFSILNRLLSISEINRHILSRFDMSHQIPEISQQQK